jgi:hypothetical protein
MDPVMRFIAFAKYAVLSATLMGCTQFPALDGAITEQGQNAQYPDLIPVETLLALSAPSAVSPEQTASGLNARVTALRNRAARLRGPVVDTNTRRRMQNGVK